MRQFPRLASYPPRRPAGVPSSTPCGRKSGSCPQCRQRHAFTLVELLVVLSLMMLMMGFVVPSISGILSAQSVSTALDRVSAMIDLARAEAVAKNTYVWVGLQNAPSGNGGNVQLKLAAVRSLDGTPNLMANGLVNYTSIAAPLSFDGAILASYPTGISTALFSKIATHIDVDNTGTFDMGSVPAAASSESFTVGQKNFANNSSTGLDKGGIILFTPQGQAMLWRAVPNAVAPYASQIIIGVCGIHGATPVQNDPRSGVLLLRGGSGQVSILRL